MMNKLFTISGHMIMTVGFFPHHETLPDNWGDENWKDFVDDLHKKKIDHSDAIFVIDVGGYIGKSTASEIEHAIKQKKQVYYLSRMINLLEMSC